MHFEIGVLKDGKFRQKLNTIQKPIANKYREGMMKRTLKRELKVPEIVEVEASETTSLFKDCGLLLNVKYM